MRGYRISTTVGPGSDVTCLIQPRDGARGRRGVILCHQVGYATVGYMNPTSAPGAYSVVAALALAGFTVYLSDLAGDAWGNDTAMSRISAGATALAAAGCAPDKVGLVGISMGGMNAWDWLAANPGKAAVFCGILPVCDPDDIRNNNRASLQASVNAAYGFAAGATSTTAPLPAGKNPTLNAAAIAAAGTPCNLFTSSADTVVVPATVSTLLAEVNGINPGQVADTVYDSTLGHTDAGVGAAPLSTICQLLANAGC